MWYDITPPISDRLEVWPGDTRPSREVICDMKAGANLTLSTLHSTVHLGAHADGPNHYGAEAPAIDQRNLDYYLGPCQVVRPGVSPAASIPPAASVPRATRITVEMVTVAIEAPRVLFATGTYPDPTAFNEDFAALAPELVRHLHDQGVILIGIDTPSVDLFESEDLPAHKAFLAGDMAILEGLVLAGVPEGLYELIALPLKLVGFDASPVRAILRNLD